MITVGEILLNARLKRKLTLEQVEKAIKIRAKFLEAMEKNQFDKLPPGTFAKGFIKNYATYLGIAPEEAMAFYRRQGNEKPVDVIPLKNQKTFLRKFAVTPQLITTGLISLLVILFFGYLIFSYIRYAGAPVLQINQPANNVVVESEEIEVSGRTNPESALLINDQAVTIEPDGSFKIKLRLVPGLNNITIKATNQFGRTTTAVRNLRLEK